MIAALSCPRCQQVPSFHGGANTSAKRGVRCAFFVGCSHVQAMFGYALVEALEARAVLDRWHAEAERIFAEYTARWTDPQRAHFRTVLGFPKSAPVDSPSPQLSAASAAIQS